MEEVYRDSAAAGCVEAAEPRDGLRNLHPELRLRRGPLRGSRPVATSTYPLLPNISRGEREEEEKKAASAPGKHHGEQGVGGNC